MSAAAVLSAALETLLLHRLAAEWRQQNYTHFQQVLKPALLRIDHASVRLGSWERRARTISLSHVLVTTHPWSAVVEVLRHEMAHQYVDEVLHVHGETAHGPAFRHVCQRMGIDPAASGLPPGLVPQEDDRVLRRITRLLALAESPNLHEAESAMAAARRLMLAYNLEHVGREHRYVFRHVGEPAKRHDAHIRWLGSVLTDFFFVRGVWVSSYEVATGRDGTVLEIAGTPENIEIASYVYGFLLETAERLWRRYREDRRLAGDRERRRYLAGVIDGFYRRLKEEGRTSAAEGLVWVGDAGLESFERRRHPRLTATRGSTLTVTGTFHDGVAAGREIVLHKPITEGPGAGPRRLLGG